VKLTRGLVLYVFGHRQPAFDVLAREAFELARRKNYSNDTLSDRWQFLRSALRLRRASYWSRLTPLTPGRFIARHLLLRVTPKLAAGLLIWYLVSPGAPQEPTRVLTTVAILSTSLALLWGAMTFRRPRADLAWAEGYRLERQTREQQLLSPEGWKGWRLERDTDGQWLLVPVEHQAPQPPAA
jgi:hypothetical protein